ncbi:MAG: serine/threonine protein kinase [Pirellulaceae bacterium]|nr:serine/threonine protein kinase [Pirellulaceae bacterium]
MTAQDDRPHDSTGEDGAQDGGLAELLEHWEAEVRLGKSPELLPLAKGDEALVGQLKPLVSVLQCLHASGLHEVHPLNEEHEQAVSHSSSNPAPLKGRLVTADAHSQELESSEHEINVPGYQILGQLGRGGMGVVYEARQLSLNRIVAIKVLPRATFDPAIASRFAREAETVASLQHPQIVPIYESGQTQGLHWFAMQKIDGQPLSEVIGDHPRGLPWKRVVEIGIQICTALSYAHSCGVVHRDIKPGNLLQDSSGLIWLADFGLAYRTLDATLTLSQAMLGTPRYMSPEQIRAAQLPPEVAWSNQLTVTIGDARGPEQFRSKPANHSAAVDHRTDIYSLGTTLFELATGQSVFEASSPLELLSAIQSDEPRDPVGLSPDIPKSLAIVILKCLEKSPRDRYATAIDLLDDLTALRDDRPISAQRMSVWTVLKRRLIRHSNRIWIATVAAAVATVGLLGSVAMYRNYADRLMARWKLTSSGGPYVISLANASGPPGSQRQIESVTLPMQQPQQIRTGSYDIQIAQPGRFSQPATMHLLPGQSMVMHYLDGYPGPPEIDIEGQLVTEVRCVENPNDCTLVTIDQQQLTAYGPAGKLLFQLSTTFSPSVPDDNEESSEAQVPRVASTEQLMQSIDFGFHRNDLWDQYWAVQPNVAMPARVLSPSTDLDGSGHVDMVLSARWKPVIAAIDHQGNMLWHVRLPVEIPEEAQPIQHWRPMELSAVSQMRLADDITGDGVAEIVVVTQREMDVAKKGSQVFSQMSVVDGRTGQVIWTQSIAPIVTELASRWPRAGLLPRPALMQQIAREMFMIQPYRPIRQTPKTGLQSIRSNLPAMLAILPPIHFMDRQGQSNVAVWHPQTGLMFFDLASGNQADPVPLQEIDVQDESLISTHAKKSLSTLHPPMADLVREVRLGKDRSKGLLFVGRLDVDAPVTADFQDDDLVLYDVDQQSVMWHDRQPMLYSQSLYGTEQSDFPLVADLDHDGIDEIYFSRVHDSSQSVPYQSIQVRDAVAGKLLWNKPARLSSFEVVPQRACVVPDINGDAVDELAVVTLCDLDGLSNRQMVWAIKSMDKPQMLYLMIDVLCGRTGRRLKLLSHPVANIPHYLEQVSYEIVGCRILGSQYLEVSLVWWNLRSDRMQSSSGDPSRLLSSASLRFDLKHDELPRVAPGLTMLTRQANAQGGYYVQRSGIEREQASKIVWQTIEAPSRLTLNQQLLGTWTSDSGQLCALVNDSDHLRIAAINVEAKQVIWEHPLSSEWGTAGFVRLGQQALAYCRSPYSSVRDSMKWFDVQTGRRRDDFSGVQLADRIIATQTCADGSGDVFVLGPRNDPIDLRWAPLRNQTIGVWRLNSTSGTVRWQKDVETDRKLRYGIGDRGTQPSIVVMDCDGDGFDDCIVTASHKVDQAKGLVALSGNEGSELWRRSLSHRYSLQGEPISELWMSGLLNADGTNSLIVMEPDVGTKYDRGVRLSLIDPKTGDERSQHLFRNAKFSHMAGLNRPYQSLERTHSDGRQVESQLSLAVPEEASASTKILNFVELRVDESELVQTTTSVQTDSNYRQILAAATVQLPNGDLRRLVCEKSSLAGYDRNGQLLWQQMYEEASAPLRAQLIATDDPRYWLLSCVGSLLSRSLFDITDGRLVWSESHLTAAGYQLDTRWETQWARHGDGFAVNYDTPEGIKTKFIDQLFPAGPEDGTQTTSVAASVVFPVVSDPRIWLYSSIDSGEKRTFQDWLVDRFFHVLCGFFGAILPGYMFVYAWRRRQFSLKWLLISPAVIMMALMAWKGLWMEHAVLWNNPRFSLTVLSAIDGVLWFYAVPAFFLGMRSRRFWWALIALFGCAGLMLLLVWQGPHVSHFLQSVSTPNQVTGYYRQVSSLHDATWLLVTIGTMQAPLWLAAYGYTVGWLSRSKTKSWKAAER